jgi:hypothetical protein
VQGPETEKFMQTTTVKIPEQHVGIFQTANESGNDFMKDFKYLAQPKRSAFDRYLIIECLMIAAVVAFAFFTI